MPWDQAVTGMSFGDSEQRVVRPMSTLSEGTDLPKVIQS